MYTISKLNKMVQGSVTPATETSENGLLIGRLWYHTASWVPLSRASQGFWHLCRGESLNLNRLHYLSGWQYWCRVHFFRSGASCLASCHGFDNEIKSAKGIKVKERDDFV